MESGDSGVTSPVLRVTAEISELKGNHKGRDGGKYSVSPSSVTSKEGRNNLFSKKKVLHPLYGYNPYQRSNYAGSFISSHQNAKNNVSSFTQRIMSAKLLRVKQLQNQLAETQLKLNEVLNENKTLRTLQQRQDNVLKKYEGNQEQLPHLIKSHHEEIRILNEKYKQIRANYRELENRMKQKDHELTNLREQYKHLLKLSRDKQLGDREKLAKKVEELESIIEQQRNKIYTLEKKLALEEKNHRYQLNQEVNRNKKIQSELNSALESINNLKSAMEAKDKFANTPYPRYQKGPQNLQIQDKAKPSHISLPAPPRVSIRQTQRLAQSASALAQEDSETADSFTLNYSPVHRGSTSLDSDNSSTGSKDCKVNNIIKKKRFNEEKISVPGSIQGGIHISKEAFRKRRETRKPTEKEILEDLPKDNKNGKPKMSKEKKIVKVSSLDDKHKSTDKTDEERSQENDQNINVVKGESTNNTVNDDNDDDTSKVNAHPPSYLSDQENALFAEMEKEVVNNNEMKIDVDTEFEKIFQSTQLTDEEISEYYQRDFRAEIYELEKKFQDLNTVSERYINGKQQMNGNAYHIPISDESESDDQETITELKDEEPKEVINIKINDENDNLDKEAKQSGSTLKESQKVSLLKALNNIDEAKRGSSRDSNYSGITNFSSEILNVDPTLTNKVEQPEKPRNSASRSKRKSEIMKDLFGVEGAAV